MFDISLLAPDLNKANSTVITFSFSDKKLSKAAKEVDGNIDNSITKSLKNSLFSGGKEQVRFINVSSNSSIDSALLVGAGDESKLTEDSFRNMGIIAGKTLSAEGIVNATLVTEKLGSFDEKEASLAFIEGLALSLYRFDYHRTNLKDADKPKFKKLFVMTGDKDLEKELPSLSALFEGVNLARDLTNHPANVVNPSYFADLAKKMKKLGIDVQVMGKKELTKLGCGLLLSVGEGSIDGGYLIVMKWNGGKKKDKYKAIVGKGVTFDTGGYSMKPADMMAFMKSDMGGAAAVFGAMHALAKRKSPVNVIGVVGAVENMVSATATRPSDVVKSYKGLTVEVNNTDAEGRLVLADAISYIIDKEKPSEVIDIATLTGAIIMALGSRYAGVFSNNDEIAKKLVSAGEEVGEPLWRMPTDPAFHKMLKSEVADLSNIGGRSAGSCTAAAFLEEFVEETPWAHIDIAGVAMSGKLWGAPNSNGLTGANGFGARLLVRYLES